MKQDQQTQTPELELTLQNVDLDTMFKKLQEQHRRKIDLITPVSSLTVNEQGLIVIGDGLRSVNDMPAGVNADYTCRSVKTFRSQFHRVLGIHGTWANTSFAQHNDLWVHEMNYMLNKLRERKDDGNMLVRTLQNNDDNGGIARAMLSDRYSFFDNFPVMQLALQRIMQESSARGLQITCDRCSLTEKKMYARFIVENFRDKHKLVRGYRDPETGDDGGGSIVAGFEISNSETGHGRLTISPTIVTGACSNGITWFGEYGMKRTHLGAKLDQETISWSARTMEINKELIFSQVDDALVQFLAPDFIGRLVTELEQNGLRKLDHPVQAVKNMGADLDLDEDAQNAMLNYFMKGGGQSRAIDAVQSLTYYAQHNVEPDRGHELEYKAASVLRNMQRYDKAPEPVTVDA